jgi:tRNA (guanine-N7-)-methyltransferase
MQEQQVKKEKISTSTSNEHPAHERHIRSFVHRSRKLTTTQQQLLARIGKQYILESKHGMLDFAKTFGRKTQVILEIGFGSGENLGALVKKFPDFDFLGIEVYRHGIAAMLEKINSQAPMLANNIRLYHDDAMYVLKNCIMPHSLQAILLFFPDPWPKRRHHKRRLLLNHEFLNLVREKLGHNGLLYFVTDNEDYAENADKTLQSAGFLPCHPTPTACPYLFNRPHTKFEQRALAQNQKITARLYAASPSH